MNNEHLTPDEDGSRVEVESTCPDCFYAEGVGRPSIEVRCPNGHWVEPVDCVPMWVVFYTDGTIEAPEPLFVGETVGHDIYRWEV